MCACFDWQDHGKTARRTKQLLTGLRCPTFVVAYAVCFRTNYDFSGCENTTLPRPQAGKLHSNCA